MHSRWSLLAWVAALALLGLVVIDLHQAQARPRRGAQHAWQRDVGHRLSRPTSRRDQRRFRFDDKLRDVPISADAVTKQIEALRNDPRARVTRIGRGTFGNPVYRIDVPGSVSPGQASPGKARRGSRGPLKVLVGAWLHGNEPAGPKAALKLVDRALRKESFRQRFDLSVIIKVDPWGTRKRPDGVNLNRCWGPDRWTPETGAIKRSVRKDHFDLFVDLHGATREGFFLIRGQNDGNVSRRILSAMKTCTLLDAAPSHPSVGPYRMHSLGGAWSGTKGTFKGYMTTLGVPYNYTLEAPRSLKPRQQVGGMFKLLRSTLDNVARHGSF